VLALRFALSTRNDNPNPEDLMFISKTHILTLTLASLLATPLVAHADDPEDWFEPDPTFPAGQFGEAATSGGWDFGGAADAMGQEIGCDDTLIGWFLRLLGGIEKWGPDECPGEPEDGGDDDEEGGDEETEEEGNEETEEEAGTDPDEGAGDDDDDQSTECTARSSALPGLFPGDVLLNGPRAATVVDTYSDGPGAEGMLMRIDHPGGSGMLEVDLMGESLVITFHPDA
jgi:hypothetical protein